MAYRIVDMSKDPRYGQFSYFKSMANPYAGITANVDVTALDGWCRAAKCGFFLPFLYCAERAANAIPELRRRLHGDGVAEYNWCPGSYTVALSNGAYCYCPSRADVPLEEFLKTTAKAQERVVSHPVAVSDESDAEELLFISCLPWITYTDVVQPSSVPADSNPRITWGRYARMDGQTLLPVTLLAHHALADGVHMTRFFKELDREIAAVAAAGPSMRELCAGELHGAVELVNRVFEEFVLPDCPAAGQETFQSYVKVKETELTLARYTGAERFWGYFQPDGTLSGVAGVRENRLSLLFVEKQYQHQGVARQLFTLACEEIRRTGYADMVVNSSPYAAEAYRHMGMQPDGERFEQNGFLMFPLRMSL
jgi:chloramphenicol O-acetyltransferase type A